MSEYVPCECTECECTRWMETQDDECDDCYVGQHSAVRKPADEDLDK